MSRTVRAAMLAAACVLFALNAALTFANATEPEAGQKAEPEIRPVRTVIAEPKPIEDDRQAVGEIRPRQESDLGFRVSGKVVSRAVDVGVAVKSGRPSRASTSRTFRTSCDRRKPTSPQPKPISSKPPPTRTGRTNCSPRA